MWLDGLNTVQHPAASTGASFHAAIKSGKFHGTICPTTPIGSLKIKLRVLLSSILADPSSVLTALAKYRKWSAANGMSIVFSSLIALPLSRHSIMANFSALSSMMSAIFNRISARSAAGTSFQSLNASHAAFTALSTSSFVASAHVDSTSPFAGQVALNVPLSDASTHSPLMNRL